jgi:hypothetical protein
MLHENTFWQCVCGFHIFQGGQVLYAPLMVMFRNRIIAQTEEVLL